MTPRRASEMKERELNKRQKNEKTAELLHEATQLLKTLRIPPKLSVMRISELDRGAAHALRPARHVDEWNRARETTVMLAEGSANRLRLKLLLSEPGNAQAWIVPMGGLADLDFTCDGLATG